jgi:hypothetical protein
MAYLLIDPPVSPLSPPSKIQAWVDRLAAWAEDPQNSDPLVRKQIQSAIDEARGWLTDTAGCSIYFAHQEGA